MIEDHLGAARVDIGTPNGGSQRGGKSTRRPPADPAAAADPIYHDSFRQGRRGPEGRVSFRPQELFVGFGRSAIVRLRAGPDEHGGRRRHGKPRQAAPG